MKYLLYFKAFAFIFIINSSMAQEDGFLLDSTRETLTMGYGTYTKTKCYYYYNNDNQLKFSDTYTNKNSFPDTADWYCTGKAYHYYDGQHLIKKDLYQNRKVYENNWTEKHKYEYKYNDTTHEKTSYWWNFETNEWNSGSEKYIDTVKPPEDYESSHLRQYWFENTHQWENDYWTDTVFLPNMLVDSIYDKYWVVGNPGVSLTVVTRYDYTYYPDTLFKYEYQPGYYLMNKIFYTDDSVIKYNFQYKMNDNGSVDTIYRKTYTYNNEFLLIQYQSATWKPQTHNWLTATTINYLYNDIGLLIQKDLFSGNHQRTIYEYNSDNLLWKKQFYDNADDPSHFQTIYYYYSYTYVNIPEQALSNFEEIVFYPNPAKSVIHFGGKRNSEKHYLIYNVTGSIIMRGKIGNQENAIDISSLVSGFYVVVMSSENKTRQGRFIKY